MRRFCVFLLTITAIVTIIVNSISLLDIILLSISTVLSFVLLRKYPITNNLSKYMVLAIIWISVVFMPAFHIVIHILQRIVLVQVDYDRLASYGIKCYFVSVLSFLFLSKIKKKDNSYNVHYSPPVISPQLVYFCFIILFFMTAFCYATGLGRMGNDAVQLPFHLSGIINLLRSKAAPIFFAALVEICLIRTGRVPKNYIILFFLWTVFEMFAWMSKSTLIYYLAPAAFVFYAYYRPSAKLMMKYLLPVIILFIFLYPIIEVARNIQGEGLSETLKEAKAISDSNQSDDSMTLTILNRVFMTGQLYAQDYSYINHESLFDFSLLPALFMVGGSGRFQTLEIDGFSPNDPQSSGSTGLIDPLLHGGEGLSYIFIIIYMLIAFGIDKFYYKAQYSIFINMLLILFSLCCVASISVIYSPDGIQTMMAQLLPIYLVYLFAFKRKKIVVN